MQALFYVVLGRAETYAKEWGRLPDWEQHRGMHTPCPGYDPTHPWDLILGQQSWVHEEEAGMREGGKESHLAKGHTGRKQAHRAI